VEHRIGEEGQGFRYILDSLNPERILNAAEVIGMGAARSTRRPPTPAERVVFGRPIGQNQSIQHPLAECWSELCTPPN
jgi:acyl-CoA dehydrogenase